MSDKFKIIVVGDVMLDRYTHVFSRRQAPEATIPVWDIDRHELRLGGAANVANNILALGGNEVEVYLAGVTGVKSLETIMQTGIKTDFLTCGSTMEKQRFVEKEKILFRVDNIQKFPDSDIRFFTLMFKELIWQTVQHEDGFDAVVFSDYDKGTITQDVVDVLRECRTKPVVVDSKRRDLRMFQGFDVLKVNEQEYGFQVATEHYNGVERLFDFVVVTKGGQGAELRQCEVTKSNEKRYMVHTEQFPVDPVEKPVDVTGCGDTHTAALTFSLLKNSDMRAAVRFANAVSRNVVKKFGTSVPSKEEA
ncbi:MAG: bifunctional heptose 7-phosphate kinase/heptose 1-phosphate adenyltransferase [Acidiferrobacterales bacterium]